MQASRAGYAKLFLVLNLFLLVSIILWQAYIIKYTQNYSKNQDFVINTLKDSVSVVESDLFFAIELVEYFEQQKDSLEGLLKLQRTKPKETTTILATDTVFVTSDSINILRDYNLPYREVLTFNGGAFEIQGTTSFKWDYNTNRPFDEKFNIEDFRLNLNLRTQLNEVPTGYEIEVLSLTPEVNITGLTNNSLTGKNFTRKVPSKVSLGIHGGFGLTPQGFTPFIGIGLTYNFIDLTELLKD